MTTVFDRFLALDGRELVWVILLFRATNPAITPKCLIGTHLMLPVFQKCSNQILFRLKPMGLDETQGVPTPNVTWYKDQLPSTEQPTCYKIREWSLSMTDLGANDTCVITTDLGFVNRTIRVEVIEPVRHAPIFTDKESLNVTALEGDTARFECAVISDLNMHLWSHGQGDGRLANSSTSLI